MTPQNLSQPRHHPSLLEKGWNLPWQTKICSRSVKITEKKLSYRKNITAQAPKEASSIVMGRVEKDFLLFSSRKGSLKTGEDTRLDLPGPSRAGCVGPAKDSSVAQNKPNLK